MNNFEVADNEVKIFLNTDAKVSICFEDDCVILRLENKKGGRPGELPLVKKEEPNVGMPEISLDKEIC